jgi:hypothetical protein
MVLWQRWSTAVLLTAEHCMAHSSQHSSSAYGHRETVRRQTAVLGPAIRAYLISKNQLDTISMVMMTASPSESEHLQETPVGISTALLQTKQKAASYAFVLMAGVSKREKVCLSV